MGNLKLKIVLTAVMLVFAIVPAVPRITPSSRWVSPNLPE